MLPRKSFASLAEDSSSTRSSFTAPRPLSSFRSGHVMSSRSQKNSQAASSSHNESTAAAATIGVSNSNHNPATLSCVSKETIQDDCARQRFIVWAAIKRNSCTRMPPEKRLSCPLLRCEQEFRDHESMLKHLASCDQLPMGEYWCYDHMKVERFDDVRCKRCLTHPSRGRKVLSLAKNFFHSLGHKSKKGQGSSSSSSLEHDVGESVISLPLSLSLPQSQPQSRAPSPPPCEEPSPLLGNSTVWSSNPSELPTTCEIVEIDSREIAPEIAIDPQALLVPALPELDSAMPPADTSMSMSISMSMPISMPMPMSMPMQWCDMPMGFAPSMTLTPPQDVEAQSAVGGKPILQVDTHMLQGYRAAAWPASPPRPSSAPRPVTSAPRSQGLSPRSSVRSNASTESNVSAASNTSTQISSASDWSWSGGGTSPESPIELDSPIDFMAEDLVPDSANTTCDALCEEFLHDFAVEPPALALAAATEPGPVLAIPDAMFIDIPDLSVGSSACADSLNVTDSLVAESSAVAVDDLGKQQAEESSVCYSETEYLLLLAYDALKAHVSSSKEKIRPLNRNSLATELRAMTTKAIAHKGLGTLRTILSGGQVRSAADVLSFVHLAYALTLVLRQPDPTYTSKDMFLQALSYASSLPPDNRAQCTNLALNIWQPSDISQDEIRDYLTAHRNGSLSRTASEKGKEPENVYGSGLRPTHKSNPLLAASENFLDELESTLVLGQMQSAPEILGSDLGSDLCSKHLFDCSTEDSTNQAFCAAANFVQAMLLRDFSDAPGLAPKLNGVLHHVVDGVICSVRRFEIELLHAGKNCMSITRYWDKFAPAVKSLCKDVYNQHDLGTTKRNEYYIMDIDIIEKFLLELRPQPGTERDDDDDDDDDDDFAQSNHDRHVDAEHQQNNGIVTSAPFNVMALAACLNFDVPVVGGGPCEGPSNLMLSAAPPPGTGASAGPSLMAVDAEDVAMLGGTATPAAAAADSVFGLAAGLHNEDSGAPPPPIVMDAILAAPEQGGGLDAAQPIALDAILACPAPKQEEQLSEQSFEQSPLQPPKQPPRQQSPNNNTSPHHHQPSSSSSSSSLSSLDQSAAESGQNHHQKKVEADSCCELCGYRPRGDPRWFMGSMAKHKKLKHTNEPPTLYRCPFPGCPSAYKNRPDNLRQHQIEKNHWGPNEGRETRRPSKRKKVSSGD